MVNGRKPPSLITAVWENLAPGGPSESAERQELVRYTELNDISHKVLVKRA
jgi:hypothetical protein